MTWRKTNPICPNVGGNLLDQICEDCGELGEDCHCAEEYCAQCDGHHRCEDEMNSGFGDYGFDDPRENR